MKEAATDTRIIDKKRLKVMSVDDSRENQKLMSALAKINDWDMDTAYDGQEAVQKYESDKFDILFMDIQMPRMDGYEAAKMVRRMEYENRRVKTPIIAITAYATQEDKQKCIAAGMDDFLSKPLNFDHLYAAIERALHRTSTKEKYLDSNPPADISKLNEMLGDDRDLMMQLIDILIDTYPKQIEKLKKALSDNDFRSFERTAHSFKGSIGNFKAKRAYELTFRLECMGRESRLDGAEDVLGELSEEMDRVKGFLLKYKS